MRYFAILGVIVLVGCGSPGAKSSGESEAAKAYPEAVEFPNGVSESDATVIAQNYFKKYYGVCGYLGGARSDGNSWVFAPKVGYGGMPVGEIRVDKSSGVITRPKKEKN